MSATEYLPQLCYGMRGTNAAYGVTERSYCSRLPALISYGASAKSHYASSLPAASVRYAPTRRSICSYAPFCMILLVSLAPYPRYQ
eukprot:1045831-Rhodomonas_salina.1